MKLTSDSVDSLRALIAASAIVDVDAVIIEDGLIRGLSEDKYVVMYSEKNVPDFGFARVGLSRLKVLANRLSLIQDSANLVVESKVGRNDDEAGSLDISWPKAKVGYRCADPAIIRCPKKFVDVAQWAVDIDSKNVPLIINALKAMGSKKVNINTRTGSEVFLELTDTNQDAFTLKIADGARWLGEDTPKNKIWVNFYSAEKLIPLLRKVSETSDVVTLIFGEKGSLQIVLEDTYRFILVPYSDKD